MLVSKKTKADICHILSCHLSNFLGKRSFCLLSCQPVRPTIEEWTGMKLQQTSLYGIRVYTEGAILAPHVDRLPLVSSCIINVAQDVEEPWLLEVYDRHGT